MTLRVSSVEIGRLAFETESNVREAPRDSNVPAGEGGVRTLAHGGHTVSLCTMGQSSKWDRGMQVQGRGGEERQGRGGLSSVPVTLAASHRESLETSSTCCYRARASPRGRTVPSF